MRTRTPIASAVLFLCAVACEDEPSTRDGLLAQHVRTALEQEPDAPADEIDVEIQDDRVVLEGEVETLLEKWAAVEAAARVVDPDSVVDRTVLDGPLVADEALQRRVNQALTVDPGTVLDVQAEVVGGVAFVRGRVGSTREREHASDVVASVPGVRAVQNLAEVEQAAAK